MLHFVLYIFSSCHVFDGIFMLGGVSCFVDTSLIYVFISVLFEIKKFICLLVLFPHMRLYILFSVSRNIQDDSIELLFTCN